jgi:hypothetical protein
MEDALSAYAIRDFNLLKDTSSSNIALAVFTIQKAAT